MAECSTMLWSCHSLHSSLFPPCCTPPLTPPLPHSIHSTPHPTPHSLHRSIHPSLAPPLPPYFTPPLSHHHLSHSTIPHSTLPHSTSLIPPPLSLHSSLTPCLQLVAVPLQVALTPWCHQVKRTLWSLRKRSAKRFFSSRYIHTYVQTYICPVQCLSCVETLVWTERGRGCSW